MKTYVMLSSGPEPELPPEFLGPDVRYPPSLVEHFLTRFTAEGDTVFDPFAGFGTTLLVAEAMGRVARGVEFDERRFRYARSRLKRPDGLISGDARRLADYDLPPFDLSLTSPPYMGRNDRDDPFTNYSMPGKGYDGYLRDLRTIYARMGLLMNPGARVVIEVANLKRGDGVTTLAWDVAASVSDVLDFEGEIVIAWEDEYGYGYDHSYCLVFGQG